MPLTAIQSEVLKAISANRSPESHIAGGIALNFAPDSPRFSEDIDIFHDVEEAVVKASDLDVRCLESAGFTVQRQIWTPLFRRITASKSGESVKLEWARIACPRVLYPCPLQAISAQGCGITSCMTHVRIANLTGIEHLRRIPTEVLEQMNELPVPVSSPPTVHQLTHRFFLSFSGSFSFFSGYDPHTNFLTGSFPLSPVLRATPLAPNAAIARRASLSAGIHKRFFPALQRPSQL